MRATPASCQADAPAAAAGNIVAYDPASYPDANTAEDLLRRIPGAQAILDATAQVQQERGFGSGGAQILLGGRRFPGKSNDIATTLRRISADSVARVEMISGAAPGISVQGQGLLVNLVLREGAAVGGSGSWELNYRFNDEGWGGVDGLASYSRTVGGWNLGVGLERNLWSPPNYSLGKWTVRTRSETYLYPDGAVQEARPQDWDRTHDKWIVTGNAEYAFKSGDLLTFNGLFQTYKYAEYDVTRLTRYDRTGAETLRATERHERVNTGGGVFEASGEYAAGLGPGDLLGLVIVRRQWNPVVDLRTRDEPTRFVEISRSESDVKTGEDIARVSYTMPVGGPTLELGAEGARNTLRQHLDVFFDFNGDGRLEPAQVPIEDPEVKELRGELFSTLKWRSTDRLLIDASLKYELSRLSTNYPLQPSRSLGFIKPRLEVRYRLDPRTQARLLAERTVSQLDFNNFVPSYNVVDDRVEAGNPALEPEKTWTYTAGVEHRLADDGGLVDLRAFYSDITDAIDKAPLRDGRGFLVSAAGNIGAARLYGLEAKGSVRLGFLGLPSAQLNLRGLRQWSQVEDPFNGTRRRLASDRSYAYDIGFRHDLPSWRASYGFTYRDTGRRQIQTDLLVTQYYTADPTLEAFVERAVWGDITLRLELENLTHSPERRTRELYAENRMDGALRRVDVYEERRDVRAALRLRGRF